MALAFECVVKSSHLNLTKNITGAFGSHMIVESSLFGRIGKLVILLMILATDGKGMRYLAWTRNEVFLECYAKNSSLEDILQFRCREALFVRPLPLCLNHHH